MNTPLEQILAWLVSGEARSLLTTDLLAGLGERLAPHVPIWRIATGLRTMNPEVAVVAISWTAEGGVVAEDVDHANMSAGLDRSPVKTLMDSGDPLLRIRLDRPIPAYPLLERFRGEGATDYVLLLLPGLRNQAISFTTLAPGGFREGDLALLSGLRTTLSLRMDLALARHVSWSLLRAYLGRDAALRVLGGQYVRALGERRKVVVFTCDLRGFTHRVDHRPLEEVLEDLDLYFECVADPWVDRGGEVLKFIGDAVLGIFPIENPAATARLALEAAAESFARLRRASEGLPEGRMPLAMGYVLHAGEVVYGNIGSRTRVDFTVIGPAVNEASRMEALTKELAPLVLSDAFAELLGSTEGLLDLGAHALRGVSRPIRVWTPAAR